jgi:large subunit ribosomal protein L5
MAKARFDEKYHTILRAELQKKLALKNVMEVPKLSKVVLNVGVKEAVSDSRILQHVSKMIAAISGQIPVITKAKKSIAGFKIREGMPLGVTVTLRRRNMYEFLDRLVNVALPNVRDFRGVKASFDRCGNYNLGIKEWTVFPEANNTALDKVYGMNITICTTAVNDVQAHALLEAFNMPFRSKDK